ncbi:DUF2145 domain-containing protein [Thalassotalea ganghwensis]
MKKLITLTWILLLTNLLITNQAIAGSNQNSKPKFKAEQIANFAKDVERYAAKQGARAFIIARLGQPKSSLPKGIEFTHTAIAIYSDITLADGSIAKGYAIHNLYQDAKDSGKSALITDYPVDFFWGAHELKAGIIIPTPDLQDKIIDAFVTGKNKQVHNPKYSLIANPYNNKYQNCTEHTLNIINAAIYETTDMLRLKRNTKAYFDAQPVKVNRLKLVLGGAFSNGMTLADHDKTIETTSFNSIKRYLAKYNLLETSYVYRI